LILNEEEEENNFDSLNYNELIFNKLNEEISSRKESKETNASSFEDRRLLSIDSQDYQINNSNNINEAKKMKIIDILINLNKINLIDN
jgi:hypothetical protein